MRRVAMMLGGLSLMSCAQLCPDIPGPDPEPKVVIDEGIFAASLGEPMASATPEELEVFEKGRDVALMRFDTDNGLGPNFNVTFCAACHERPTVGGSAPRYRDFFLVATVLEDGSFVGAGVNGVQGQFNTGGPLRNPTEETVNNFAARSSIPFFGVGALAAITEEAILANVDEEDADGDGISGRPNYDRGFVGRFGRKSQTVSIEGFIRGPLFNHLGVTTVPLSNEFKAKLPIPSVADQEELEERNGMLPCINCQAAAPAEPNFDDDGVPDPEMTEQQLFELVAFSMLIGAPAPDAPTPQSIRGGELFEEIQCAACHIPTLEGPNGAIPAYSDLLLHDMGEEMSDGVIMGVATGSEFRTQPLWGVVATGPYLHDGRASTLDEAILAHGGEAKASRDTYAQLSDGDRGDLIAFLESLGGKSQYSPGLVPPGEPAPEVGEWGGPSRELQGAEKERFNAGRLVFDRDANHVDGLGLGKGFNGDSCRACHFDPVLGGSGPPDVNVTRQGIVDVDTFAFQNPAGGTMLHHHNADRTRPVEDATCNVIELRQTPALFGLGLIDEIPESSILANADSFYGVSDGITGKAHILPGGDVGRFGWKANIASLEDFVRDALSNELGLTLEDGAQFVAGVAGDDDDVADPEFGGSDYENLVFWSKLLGPPPRGEVGPDERAGETLFAEVGCAACHIPELQTADGQPVPLYSDLLLHDVAPEGYLGIEDGQATIREFRTPPLWGIRATKPYMHDGLAPTLDAAIRRHFAEGDASRRAYEGLSAAQREQLLKFLGSL